MTVSPKLTDYVFTERLGKGSSAVVFKAYRKERIREAVAVKCIEKKSLTKISVENILTEISIHKNIKHEYIVELKDFQWDDNYIYLIMEYCSGGELSLFIRRQRRLPETIVRHFLQQLAKALQVLRAHNIAHMDLKPQNILLSSNTHPVIKLADFGLAQHLHPYDTASSLRGSPLYMAPEIFLQKHYDARVDLWSLGIILYECLFGKAPYSSQSFAKLVEKIKTQKPIEIPYGAGISDECRNLLVGLLQRDPDKRMTFEEFFAHPFLDLEHMPSSESYDKGVNLIQQAVVFDQKQQYEAALDKYSEGLQYLVPIVQWEADGKKKAVLRSKVLEYLDRAQVLKRQLKGPTTTSLVQLESKNTSEVNCNIAKMPVSRHPLLNTGRREVQEADKLVMMGRYSEALHKYEASLEVMVPYLKKLQDGNERKELYAEVEQWMKKAENAKSYLKMGKLSVNEHLLAPPVDLTASLSNSCSIQ